MKKTLKILVLTLLVSFGFLTGLKAESKTLDCKYRHYYYNSVDSDMNFDFIIKYTIEDGKKYANFELLSEKVTAKNGTSFTINSDGLAQADGRKVMLGAYDYVNKDSCPPIYYAEGDNNTIYLKLRASVAASAAVIQAGTIDNNGVDTTLNEKLKLDSTDKVCKIGIDKYSISGEKKDDKKASKMQTYTFYVITKSNGKVYGKIGDENTTKEISASSSEIAWSQVVKIDNKNVYFSIKSSEAVAFKNAFSYNSSSCPSLYYERGGRSNNTIYVSLEKTENSVEATSDFKIEENSTFTSLKKDSKIDLAISDEIGTCETYLGNAETEGTIAYYLQIAFTIIKVVSIIIVIITAMIDLASVITNDKDNLMDTVKKYVKRLIILIIILLLPMFINVLGTIFGLENILCGIK